MQEGKCLRYGKVRYIGEMARNDGVDDGGKRRLRAWNASLQSLDSSTGVVGPVLGGAWSGLSRCSRVVANPRLTRVDPVKVSAARLVLAVSGWYVEHQCSMQGFIRLSSDFSTEADSDSE